MKPQNPPTEQQKNGLIEPELQHNIPVKLHDSQIPKNPINSQVSASAKDSKKSHEPDDKILQEVNKSVKEADKKPAKKSLFSFHKKQTGSKLETLKPEKIEPSKAKPPSKPVFAVVSAVIAAAVLSVAAVYAFSAKNSGAPLTSSQQSTNTDKVSSTPTQSTKITSSDLTKAASDLNSKVDSLNDAQDFNANDLSDSSLGLQ